MAFLDTLDLLLGQWLLGTLDDAPCLVLNGDGLVALVAPNANLVDLGASLAAEKLGMCLCGVVFEHLYQTTSLKTHSHRRLIDGWPMSM